MTMDKDERTILGDYEIRTGDDDQTIISGYAIKFNTPSTNIRSFVEVVERSALDGVDLSNVFALVNHDFRQALGKVGHNLTLTIDDVGLRFEIIPNNTSYAKDLIENMRSGIVDKCSFGFTIAKDGDKWEKRNDNTIFRTITQIEKLYEISVVTLPAYGDTEAKLSARSLEEMEKALNPSEEYRKQLLDMELGLY